MPTEVTVITTYKRDPLLYVTLRRLRKVYDGPVVVFSDRGYDSADLRKCVSDWHADRVIREKHDRHGNTVNASEALKWAYRSRFELTHYLEDDSLVGPHWRDWTLKVHESDRIFCSAGWVCTREFPYADFTYFAPWIYIPQFSIKRDKLAEIVRHLKPEYYDDMRGYIQKTFPNTPLNKMTATAINHYEIDGLIQHILMENQGCQVAWNSMPTVMHLGFGGYNRGGYENFDQFFFDCGTFEEKVAKVETLADDPYWRAQLFGRQLVECESGSLPKRSFRYHISLPGGWESEMISELEMTTLPPVLNSVRVGPSAKIALVHRST